MILPLFIILPLSATFINSICGRFLKRFSDVFINLVNFALVVVSFVALYQVSTSQSKLFVYQVGGWKIPYGISLVMDSFTVFMLLTVNVVAFLVGVYSISYIERYTEKWGFYSLFELMLAGMNGVIISGDLFNIFVFLEIASISSYALVAFGVEKDELEAAFKYIVLSSISTGLVLLAIALTYGFTSTLNLADIAKTIAEQPNNSMIVKIIMFLFIVGFGIKAAVVPLHWWLPDAYPSAPAPISAMLSGVLTKTLGVYLIVRFVFNVFLQQNLELLKIIFYLGILSMVVGVILALYQWDYKRLLAYHSISQVGYMLLGVGLATPTGILGGMFHLLNHSVFKSLLFLTSGALEYNFATRDLRKYTNVSKIMPNTTFFGIVGSFSIAGVPPFNGFWSKLMIIIACIEAKNIFAGLVAIIVSVLTLASFLKVIKYGFYKTDENIKEIEVKKKEVPIFMQIAMMGLTILCIILGFLLYPEVKQAFLDRVVEIIYQNQNYFRIILNNQ
ncbi:MAG: monovalent cation/H+ antiporter subunit D family protein [Endomicrobia bacterium]|nr:monovalent cation/H+ antiporter subunit D family protein [Endomicrobiia bacterium]